MTPEYKRKIWKWTLFVVLPILYCSGFGLLSLADFVVNKPYRQTIKMLTTEGTSLYVGTSIPYKTFQQEFFYQPLTIDGADAQAWTEDGKLLIEVGDEVIERNDIEVNEWCWAPKNHCLFFFDGGDKSDPPNRHIWKWSKPTGFVRISSIPRPFYNLTVSLDDSSICAMIYETRSERENSIYSCSINGGKEYRAKYDFSNFKPVMLANGIFLLEVENDEEVDHFGVPSGITYRWTPGSEATIFKIGDRMVRSVDAVGGSIWVLFQEPQYHWYPWKYIRGNDKVTVARLSEDLTKIVEEIPLRSEE